MKTLQMLDLPEVLKTLAPEHPQLLDVRTDAEFAAGHVKGALHIPHDTLEENPAASKTLKKEAPTVIYCKAGGRAQFAAQVLAERGFNDLYVVVGSGMPDWTEAGLAVEK